MKNYYSEDGVFLLKLGHTQGRTDDPTCESTGQSGTTMVSNNHNCTINLSPTFNYAGIMPPTPWTSSTGPTHWLGYGADQAKLGGTEEGEGGEELKGSELGQREQQLPRETEEEDPALIALRYDSRNNLFATHFALLALKSQGPSSSYFYTLFMNSVISKM